MRMKFSPSVSPITFLKMTSNQPPIWISTVSTDRADGLYFFCIHDRMKTVMNVVIMTLLQTRHEEGFVL